MIELDGTVAEGGGQILRTALALSVITQKRFRMVNIRKSRNTPGLKPQHLGALEAMKLLCDAKVEGDTLGSETITFTPGQFKGGKLEIDIGSAGSVTLLLQSLLPAMVRAKKRTTLRIIGGTDVEWSMPFDFLKHVFLPHLVKYAKITCKLLRRGYHPKGEGIVEVSVDPNGNTEPIIAMEQGQLLAIKGIVNSSASLQGKRVAERISQSASAELKGRQPVPIESHYSETASDGCGIVLWSLHATGDEIDAKNPIILGADELGELRTPSEEVGRKAAHRLLSELASKAAVDRHTADNLIPFMGIFGGEIRTSEITQHIKANIYVTEQFLDMKFEVDEKNKTIMAVRRGDSS